MSQKAHFWRFSDDLADVAMVSGTHERLSDNFDELKDILDQDEEYEDAQVLQDPIQIY